MWVAVAMGISMALADLGFALVVNYRSDEQAAVCDMPRSREAWIASAIAIRADVADIEQGRRLLDETIRCSRPCRPLGQQCRRRAPEAVRYARNHARKLGPRRWRPIFGDRFS